MKYMLRSLKLKDSEGILEWMHDPKINLWYTGKIKNATLNRVINFINNAEELMKQGTTRHYAIVNEEDEYLGTISLKNIEPIKGAEYAISMRGTYQGKGIASWATQEIMRMAFDDLGLHRVYLNVPSDNEHANRFYVRNHFRYEGEAKDCIQIEGRIKSLKWYALLEEEYREIMCKSD